MPTITVFSATSGLNTVADPVRVPFDQQTGTSDLALAKDIDIDQYGRPSRRVGRTLLSAGSFQKVFCDGGDCFAVEDRELDSAIFQVAPDLTIASQSLQAGLSRGAPVVFAQTFEKTFYCNGFVNGVIEGGVSSPWPVQEYSGPDTTRVFSGAPVGNKLEFAFGRMFVIVGDVVYWSERFMPGLYDMARNFWQFGSQIRMFRAVAGGYFISDSKATYFYKGLDPAKVDPIRVAPFPACEGTDALDKVVGMDVGMQEPGECLLWASPEGACLGTPSGMLINLNKEKIIYPDDAVQGSGLLRGYHFIHTVI